MRILLAFLLATTCLPAQQITTGNAPQTFYKDPKTGVTFSYPSVWVPSEKAPQYMSPAFAGLPGVAEPLTPRASFVFSPVGNLYEHTVLLGLVFSYFAFPAQNEQECVKAVITASGGTRKHAFTVHRLTFQEVDGGDAGMCHEQANQLAVTYQGGQCLVFERDLNTECFGAGDGKRKLTPQENRALQRHLDEVMQSVRLVP